MRIFDIQEKTIINKIISGEGYARNLINIVDNFLSGVRIILSRKEKTAKFLFETANSEPTEKEISSNILREKRLIELLITHLTLLRYLEKEELAFLFEPAEVSNDIVTFGQGAVNAPSYSRAISDKTIVDLLLRYVDKEIRPSPLLRQLVKNNYLSDEEKKFQKQYFATWFTIITSAVLGLYGIYNNHQNSIAQEKQFKKQLNENEKLSRIISDSIKGTKVKAINYKSNIKKITNALSQISKNLSETEKEHVVKVEFVPQLEEDKK